MGVLRIVKQWKRVGIAQRQAFHANLCAEMVSSMPMKHVMMEVGVTVF
jgi:hypothetical protein